MVLVRHKKTGIQLISSNIPTPLAMMFHNHAVQLPGFPDLHRVESAYVLNQFETALDWIGIVARHKKRILWHYELDTDDRVIRLPLPERTDAAAARVLKPKAQTDIKSEDENT